MPRSKRFAVDVAPRVPGSADCHELAEVASALEREGSRPMKTWSACCREGRRFVRWLEGRGLDLDHIRSLCERDAHDKPIVPTSLLLAFIDDNLLNDEIKPKSAYNAAGYVISWLQGTGWCTSHLKRGGAGLALVSALVRNHRYDDLEAHLRIPARPVMDEWVDRIAEEIEACREDPSIQPLWVDAMLVYHVLTFYMAMRSSESATHLRWGWIDDRDDRLEVLTPGGDILKQQIAPATLIVPANPTANARCPVALLRAWREVCIDAGIPVGDDALVFPAIRKVLPEFAPTVSQPWWGDRLWVANPIDDEAAAAREEGCDPTEVDRRIHSARVSQRNRYATEWTLLARTAGFTPRHRFERVSSHGLRRGAATTMRTNGAPAQAVANHLRQQGATTSLYIDIHEMEAPDTRPLFAIDGLPSIEPLDSQVETLLDPLATMQHHNGRCAVLWQGVPCERDFYSHFDIGDGPMPACEGHTARANKGLRGDDLCRPINSHLLGPTCDVPHNGTLCDEDAKNGGFIEFDGDSLTACRAHLNRFIDGKTGDDLTRPVHFRRLSGTCEVVHRGVVCGRDSKNGRRMLLDGIRIEMCSAHRQRYLAGKRGDALTQPIDPPPLSSCEIAHRGTNCGRPSKTRIKIEGVLHEICPGHRTRWVNGKRGDAFTKPIRTGGRWA